MPKPVESESSAYHTMPPDVEQLVSRLQCKTGPENVSIGSLRWAPRAFISTHMVSAKVHTKAIVGLTQAVPRGVLSEAQARQLSEQGPEIVVLVLAGGPGAVGIRRSRYGPLLPGSCFSTVGRSGRRSRRPQVGKRSSFSANHFLISAMYKAAFSSSSKSVLPPINLPMSSSGNPHPLRALVLLKDARALSRTYGIRLELGTISVESRRFTSSATPRRMFQCATLPARQELESWAKGPSLDAEGRPNPVKTITRSRAQRNEDVACACEIEYKTANTVN